MRMEVQKPPLLKPGTTSFLSEKRLFNRQSCERWMRISRERSRGRHLPLLECGLCKLHESNLATFIKI